MRSIHAVWVLLALLLLPSLWTRAEDNAVPDVAIDKITIAVVNMDAMKTFYARAFGAELKDIDMGGGVKLAGGRLGAYELLFCPREIAGVVAEQNTIQLRFVVPDVAASHKTALESGGTAISPDAQRQGDRATWDVRDPDGNSIELIQK